MSQKRKQLDQLRDRAPRPKKRIRKQKEYHSSSEEESEQEQENFTPFNLDESEAAQPHAESSRLSDQQDDPEGISDEEQSSESGGDDSEDLDGLEAPDEDSLSSRKKASKKNDPAAFSNSISKILSTTLPQALRSDPLLARSKEASDLGQTRADERLERKARTKLRAEKLEALERGHLTDVLGLKAGQAGEVAEEEKRLRKIAQRGVVKLFNAVRAAQVRAEEAAKEERRKGTVGMTNREAKVNEMSKQGFLDLINGKPKIAE